MPPPAIVPRRAFPLLSALLSALLLAALPACSTARPRVGQIAERRGDEIMVAGQLVHTGTPVVLWFDAGGYDAYRVERRFGPADKASWNDIKNDLDTPNRYGMRRNIDPATAERVRGGGWTIEDLQASVDQFVLHYDVCGLSQTCFRVLHDQRGLSIHFMLDIDGTIYQTLDLKERAWHATKANDRSVGIEIAHMGAYPPGEPSPLDSWYTRDARGWRIKLPERVGDGGVRTPNFVGRPARDGRIPGEIHGHTYEMFDLTDEQYDALIHLTAALCRALPRIQPDAPRDADGKVLTRALTDDEFQKFAGLLGHFHVQTNKIDPGPGLDWDRVLNGARAILRREGRLR